MQLVFKDFDFDCIQTGRTILVLGHLVFARGVISPESKAPVPGPSCRWCPINLNKRNVCYHMYHSQEFPTLEKGRKTKILDLTWGATLATLHTVPLFKLMRWVVTHALALR